MNILERLKFIVRPMRCRKCGKLLFSPKSRKLGFGPECARGGKATREREALEKAGQQKMF